MTSKQNAMANAARGRTPENVLVIPDIHYRKKAHGHDRRSLDAVKVYARDHQWSHVVFLGDVMDHNSISHHNKTNLRSISGETLQRDYDVANADLDEFAQACSGASFVVIEGNHDWRPKALVNEKPQLEGKIETENGLRLAERGWLWVPYWSDGKTFDLGKASFGHGKYTNLHHAYKHATRYGRNFYYGHVHDVQEHTMERDGDSKQYEAASLGCLCDVNQEYMAGAPSKWQQAFGVFRFRSNGFFQRYTVRVFNHAFISPEDSEYSG